MTEHCTKHIIPHSHNSMMAIGLSIVIIQESHPKLIMENTQTTSEGFNIDPDDIVKEASITPRKVGKAIANGVNHVLDVTPRKVITAPFKLVSHGIEGFKASARKRIVNRAAKIVIEHPEELENFVFHGTQSAMETMEDDA